MLNRFKPTHVVERIDANSVKISVKDPICPKGTMNSILLNKDQFARYENWMSQSIMIQHALYDLSESDREILISGTSPENFDRLFKDDR